MFLSINSLDKRFIKLYISIVRLKLFQGSFHIMRSLIAFKFNIVLLFTLLFTITNTAFGVDTTEVKVIDTAGCNLAIVDETSPNTYSLKSTSKTHNWFAGIFECLNTSSPTTFSLCMDGTGTTESPGDVSKWDGLWPVYTYGEYSNYDTYIYYTKNDDGYWVSSDVFAKEKLTGNGKTPMQTAIPAELAEEFLSDDGKYWSAWAELQDTHADKGSNTFFMTHQFNSPNVSIAMKYPYTYDYELEYMTKLKRANIPGITVHAVGKNEKEQELFIVEINDPNATAEELKERRVVLIYANEDGDEADSSWVAHGALNFLVSGSDEAKNILQEVTFLIIPMLDPIGWAESTYGKMTYSFDPTGEEYFGHIRPEIGAYATFIVDWTMKQERRLDVVINLHNIECTEGPNIMFPMLERTYFDSMKSLREYLLNNITSVKTGNTIWSEGFFEDRYMGWCTRHYGTISVLTEINSRYPGNRMNLADINNLGKDFTVALHKYFSSDAYERALPKLEKAYSEQLVRYKKALVDGKAPNIPPIYFILRLGL